MKFMLALLVLVLGLEGVDRALLDRAMESMKPPREPAAFRALAMASAVPKPSLPPPPPPPPDPGDPSDWAMN